MNRRTGLIAAGIFILAVLAALLSFHRSYSPGPLTEGHQPFGANCAACHQPWRGVQLASASCIDCHGNLARNEHANASLDDKRFGLIAGGHIVGFDDRLACLSCHTDHKGRKVDLAATSGTNCATCHAHDSIQDVSSHSHGLRVRWKPLQNFLKDFSHKQHLEDAIKHLQDAKAERAKNACASAQASRREGRRGTGDHARSLAATSRLPVLPSGKRTLD